MITNIDDICNSLRGQGQTQPQPQHSVTPQLQNVMDMVKNSNMSAKDLFYKMAKEKGADPDAILDQVRNLARFK